VCDREFVADRGAKRRRDRLEREPLRGGTEPFGEVDREAGPLPAGLDPVVAIHRLGDGGADRIEGEPRRAAEPDPGTRPRRVGVISCLPRPLQRRYPLGHGFEGLAEGFDAGLDRPA
jgi:hypothetical protein